jgi:very-short-patch-repair endonuclease
VWGADQVMQRQRNFPQANARAKRLRRKLTPAEQRLWEHLQRIEGRHFRKQTSIGPHVFDFAELAARLIIEVDGGIHDLSAVKSRDAEKEAWAVSQGFTVLRIPNVHVFGTGNPALQSVMTALRDSEGIRQHPDR